MLSPSRISDTSELVVDVVFAVVVGAVNLIELHSFAAFTFYVKIELIEPLPELSKSKIQFPCEWACLNTEIKVLH